MKKLGVLFLTIAMILCIPTITPAAEPKVTVSEAQADPSQMVYLTVSLSDCKDANTVGVSYEYDTKVLKKAASDFKWKLKDGKIEDFDISRNIGAWTTDSAKDLNGELCVLAFRVNADAVDGVSVVKCKVDVKNDSQVVGSYTAEAKVTIGEGVVDSTEDGTEDSTEGTTEPPSSTEPPTSSDSSTEPPAGADKPVYNGPQYYIPGVAVPSTPVPESNTNTSTPTGGNQKPEKVEEVGDTVETPILKLTEDTVKEVVDVIENAESGAAVIIEMQQEDGTVATVVPAEILESVKGKDINVVLDMGNYSWIINGNDITDVMEINLEVVFDTSVITEDVIKEVAGEDPTRQLSLTHEGDFGFDAVLKINLGNEYQGMYGNLYYYDNSQLVFMNSGVIDENGDAVLNFSHASDYVVVIGSDRSADTGADGVGDTSADTGVETSSNNSGAIIGIIAIVVIIAVGIILFKKNKNK